MRFDIILHDEAIVDLRMAIYYYKDISPRLAKKFHSSVKNTFNELRKNPFYEVRYDNVRLRLVKGFPYILHFVVVEKYRSVIIYGIRHAAQDPDTSYFFDK